MTTNAKTANAASDNTKNKRQPISTTSEWSFELIQRYDEEIAKIAEQFGLDTYPNQIEVISSEQMHRWAYASWRWL